MEFRWDPEYLAFRDEVKAFIQEWYSPEFLAEVRKREGASGPALADYYKALQAKGWMRMCWPSELGGAGRAPLYQFNLIEAMEY